MIDRSVLVEDLQRLLKKLEVDLRARTEQVAEIDRALQEQYREAVAVKRTGEPFKEWREEVITQVAVGWILGCVFVRFLEDNAFLDAPLLSGTGDNLSQARDQHIAYVRKHPTDSDREYLQHVFETVAALPVLGALYDKRHNPLWLFGPSADGAQMLLTFWQQADATAGTLRHDFTDASGDTRFLGDLYQDLSESARKRYALLQTPVFVEEFILERTLDPAIETFGLAKVRMIDPTCGSGHFLLGAFNRILGRWQKAEPATNVIELIRRTLDAIYGVDINPYAAAIARFRLLIAALRACQITKIRSAPAWKIHAVAGDSLLLGPEPTQEIDADLLTTATSETYRSDQSDEASYILSQRYHAVVGNPPYIEVPDPILKDSYKQRFGSCYGSWVLSVPFFERFFGLAFPSDSARSAPAGFVGKITSNSFMKRELGKKLIQIYMPRWNLTHVIDTTYVELPDHNTPTVVVFGRNEPPVSDVIRTAMGIKGQAAKPADPADGLVWHAILDQIDRPGSESEFISVVDKPRAAFHKHPWSLGGGGAAELKERLDQQAQQTLGDIVARPRNKPDIGFASFTGCDEAFASNREALRRQHIPERFNKPFITGDIVRDWGIARDQYVFAPYDDKFELIDLDEKSEWFRFLWPNRTCLKSIVSFDGKDREAEGQSWWGWYRWVTRKYENPLSITFAEVASHNHFAFDQGGRVFKQTAPVIKLPPEASAEFHLTLLGLLNSSVACFWLKQVCQPKGTVTGDISSEKGKSEANRFAFNSTALANFPLPDLQATYCQRIGSYATRIVELVDSLDIESAILNALSRGEIVSQLRETIQGVVQRHEAARQQMVFLQEEIDWTVYVAYGLCEAAVLCPYNVIQTYPQAEPSLRPFALGDAAALRVLPQEIKEVWSRRFATIRAAGAVTLIESANFKRPWLGRQGVYGSTSRTPQDRVADALRSWLLDRMEQLSHTSGRDRRLFSVNELAERSGSDSEFQRVAELYARRPDFDLVGLVSDLVQNEVVPSLPGQRYKESGLRKREQWEEVWAKQRIEDDIGARLKSQGLTGDSLKQAMHTAVRSKIGEMPVPPKYKNPDFAKGTYWRLRGQLDVPSERWVCYPGVERAADQSLVLGWAGWNHLQQAQAIAAHYERLRNEGASDSQLARLLASLQQLVPWLLQWHNELDPEFQLKMGDYFRTFIEDESRRLHLTAADIERLAKLRG